jgi:hypothetical protein
MTDLSQLAKSLTKAQREALVSWKWRKWVAIRADVLPLIPTGLVDVRRFPNRADGIRKASLNRDGLALRAHLKGQSDEG